MKKWPAATLAGALLASALAPTQAHAADTAPTNVRIAWKDSTHQEVRVTWTEEGTRPNRISVRSQASPTALRTFYVASDAPDELDIPASSIAPKTGTDAVFQIGVAAGTEAGETSAAELSPAFDMLGPVFMELDSYSLAGGSTLSVKWKRASVQAEDKTPNDPLDVTGTDLYQPQYVKDGRTVPLGEPTRSTALTFTGPRPPFTVELAGTNEWIGSDHAGATISVASYHPTASIPAWVRADTSQNTVRGTFTGSGHDKVILQARNSATSPWYTVGWQNFTNNQYAFDMRAAGSRQYRVQLPNTVKGERAFFGGYSPVVSTTVQTSVGANFWNPTIRVGQTSRAAVYMRPYLVGHARLERWNGKTWTLVGPVPIANGLGFGYIRGATPGRVAYRYYIPAGTLNGQWFAAAYSTTFVLTTTR
ncbi:hypothetical protein FB561_0906 [Kribbella amoyensis]|uniref:Uncharacterized protein n=1 Tax=Kribbella amoyensis TaxID=996641 RepID=A0A561BLR6_9ACTN|nr:hypothetical protein [Kribbella amoyensis]TWD79840.1 hypothetical protein FB561_0906 [Kribbella amoyensis]